MEAWEKHAADLYLLASDILDKLYQQREGYRSSFYYGFNPNLQYLACNGSALEQAKLLQQLADKGMLDFENEVIESDMPEYFISANALGHNDGKAFWITIHPDAFNEQMEILKKYKPSNLHLRELPLSKVVAQVGEFYIHENNMVSYEGRLIKLEPQVAKVAAYIMLRSKNQHYTSLKLITDECLGEDYKDKVSSANADQAANYIRRTISKARSGIQAVTHSEQKFFYSKPGEGYIFKP